MIENPWKWPIRYMKVAEEISTWSPCLKRKVGCVITNQNRIIATGYNGAPVGVNNCVENNKCLRESSKSSENLDVCLATHAEQNAITQAAKMGISVDGGEIYVTTCPCITCLKMIINSGIKRIFYLNDYPRTDIYDSIVKESGIELYQMDKRMQDA